MRISKQDIKDLEEVKHILAKYKAKPLQEAFSLVRELLIKAKRQATAQTLTGGVCKDLCSFDNTCGRTGYPCIFTHGCGEHCPRIEETHSDDF